MPTRKYHLGIISNDNFLSFKLIIQLDCIFTHNYLSSSVILSLVELQVPWAQDSVCVNSKFPLQPPTQYEADGAHRYIRGLVLDAPLKKIKANQLMLQRRQLRSWQVKWSTQIWG